MPGPLGWEDKVGEIAAGKYADIIAAHDGRLRAKVTDHIVRLIRIAAQFLTRYLKMIVARES